MLAHAEQGRGKAGDRDATVVPVSLQKSLAFGSHESQAESKNRDMKGCLTPT